MLKMIYELFAELWHDESGHNFMEYAMLLSLVAMAIFGAIHATAANLNGSFETIANKFQ